MDSITIGSIRKIIIGADPLKGLAVVVGQRHEAKGGIEITHIVRDEANYYYFGIVRYMIYAKKSDGTKFIWKTFEGVPVTVECEIP